MGTEILNIENAAFEVAVEEPQYEVNECAYWNYFSNWCELKGKHCYKLDKEKCKKYKPVLIED